MIKIDGVKIGQEHSPYVIAELSANHGGSIDVAKESIRLAKESGASAVKIQSYTPDTMTIESHAIYSIDRDTAVPSKGDSLMLEKFLNIDD